MRKITIAACAVSYFLSAAAQDPNKNNNRITSTNTRVSSIPGLKTAARGTKLDNRQVAVIGLGMDPILFTEDPKIINFILQITNNTTPVNQAFTPSRACPDENNCIFYNTTITDIQNGYQQWTFKRNAENKSAQLIKLMPKLQPDKDYLVVVDANVEFRSPNVDFSVIGYRINGKSADQHYFKTLVGKNQFTFILHTNADYKFVGLGTNCAYLALITSFYEKPGDPATEFLIHVNSVKIKEINMN